jgi:hypothetical protein
MTAIGAEELDLLVPELLPMTIKLAPAFWTGHPKNFCHDCAPRAGERKFEIRISKSDVQKARNPNIEIRNKLELKLIQTLGKSKTPDRGRFEFCVFPPF